MRKQGTIRRWDDARGFGFIDSGDSRDVFVHVRDFARSGVSPVSGMQVTYEEIQVGGKGPRAMDVRAVSASPASAASAGRSSNAATSTARTAERRGDRPREAYRTNAPGSARQTRPESRRPARASATGSSLAMLLMLVWLALLAGGVWFQRLPLWVLGAMLVLNLVTFVVYALDKSAAQSGRWRTSEKQLHLMAVLGGWPAAWFAQQALRHKSSKQEFRAVYWATVIGHCVLLGVLTLHPDANALLSNAARHIR